MYGRTVYCNFKASDTFIKLSGIILALFIDNNMKNTGVTGGLLAILLLIGFTDLRAQGDVISDVKSALNAGSSKELVKFLDKTTDIDVDGDRSSYSRTQAEVVLKDFFKKYPPTNFQIIHQGASRAGSPYVIGQYTFKAGTFRVWIILKKEDEIFRVHAMSFYKD